MNPSGVHAMKHEKFDLDDVEADAGRRRPARRSVRLRILLLALGPGVVLVGGLVSYLHGGRFVSTDNAYIHATIVPVTAQVSGPISNVEIRDNERVRSGQILFAIDPRPYELALRQAEAMLDKARNDVAALKASYREKVTEIGQARSDRGFAERDWNRQRNLAARNVVSRARLDKARHDYVGATQKVAMLREALARIAASLHGNPNIAVDDHPSVREVLARRDRARLNLDRTEVRAPVSGVVSAAPGRGQYVTAGSPVFSLVAVDGLWVEANFKETELTHLRPGQPAAITVDTYPGREWAGRVDSVAQATGAVFSVLPAQNASGNWVKVVQRVPVRIAIADNRTQPILRAGLSVEVSVDTGYRRSLAGLFRSLRRLLAF